MTGLPLQSAFILHRRPFSDSSLLLECFTRENGRFPAVARRSSGKSYAAAPLQPFTPLLIEWRGKGEVVSLLKYEPDGRGVHLKGRSLFCGFYINELLVRLLPRDDPHPDLFELYATTLAELQSTAELESVLRRFELKLLQELGYGITLSHDSETGQVIQPDRHYHFIVERGPVCASLKGDETVAGSTLLALAGTLPMQPAYWKEARNLTRKILNHYLGDKPLKSRDLFRNKPS